ncbi:hypothetical protein M8J77_008490 [Diaphorina citri]|nr:hypothetical protein M8J77_008490 [Diaphorina citri]
MSVFSESFTTYDQTSDYTAATEVLNLLAQLPPYFLQAQYKPSLENVPNGLFSLQIILKAHIVHQPDKHNNRLVSNQYPLLGNNGA